MSVWNDPGPPHGCKFTEFEDKSCEHLRQRYRSYEIASGEKLNGRISLKGLERGNAQVILIEWDQEHSSASPDSVATSVASKKNRNSMFSGHSFGNENFSKESRQSKSKLVLEGHTKKVNSKHWASRLLPGHSLTTEPLHTKIPCIYAPTLLLHTHSCKPPTAAPAPPPNPNFHYTKQMQL